MTDSALLQIEWPLVDAALHRSEARAHSDVHAALTESDALFASLQHRAFSGGI